MGRNLDFESLQTAWQRGNLGNQLLNSLIMAGGITIGKISVSLIGAYSIVYFDYRVRTLAFVTVFCTLMLPVDGAGRAAAMPQRG